MEKTRNPDRLTKTLLETAADMRRIGAMDAAAHNKITLRHLGGQPELPPARNLYARIRARFEPLGGMDDLEPPRLPDRDPPCFNGDTDDG